MRAITYIPTGLQISHSGRKGSAYIPWIKKNASLNKKNGWNTFAPSSIRRCKDWPVPIELKKEKINKIINDFKNTARKAKRIGFDALELHMAHGYLLHQFLSPISNHRKDEFGGNLKNRCKIPLIIAKEIRKIWPKNKILGARITGLDHLKNGIKIKDAVYLSKKLKAIGFDYICVSSGGIIPITNLKFKKGFRVPLSKIIKKKSSMITRTSGLITDLNQANKLIKNGSADLIAMARELVRNPTWIHKAALKMKKTKGYIPNQYIRCF